MEISNICDKRLNNIEQNLSSCCILLDMSKAFDTVDHKILLNKMEQNFGFAELLWKLELFKSYLLSDCCHYTKVQNATSTSAKILCGVPQELCL